MPRLAYALLKSPPVAQSLSSYRAVNRNRWNFPCTCCWQNIIGGYTQTAQSNSQYTTPTTASRPTFGTSYKRLYKFTQNFPRTTVPELTTDFTIPDEPQNCCIELRNKRLGIYYLHSFIHKTRIYHKTLKYRTEIHKTRVFWLVDLSVLDESFLLRVCKNCNYNSFLQHTPSPTRAETRLTTCADRHVGPAPKIWCFQ